MGGEAGSGDVGVVLAGGGARGAYEIGALSELLPALPADERPRVIVGTSVGAVNASYLAATADEPAETALARGAAMWEAMGEWESALAPLVSFAQIRMAWRAAADVLGFPGARTWALLDPSPLRGTLSGRIPFDRIRPNVESGAVTAAAVVATRAATSLSVVFCDCAERPPRPDLRRGIEYAQTELSIDHVLASAAIPAAFPAVEVREPPDARGWYFDGGTRLNTPIRPALDFGCAKLIVIALHPPRVTQASAGTRRPQVLDGVGALLQGALVDPLVNDVLTLTTINRAVLEGSADGSFQPVPYILIAPEEPFEIGEVATRVYREHYKGLRRRRGSVARLARVLDVEDGLPRGELLSYLFFDRDFIGELIELGRRDARRWLSQTHDLGHWRTGPLPGEAQGRSGAVASRSSAKSDSSAAT